LTTTPACFIAKPNKNFKLPQDIIHKYGKGNHLKRSHNKYNLNKMYNEQIENLISLALSDGELSEKEKQILFKKAEAAGIDLDEFEMVLDAKLFEKQQTIKAVAPSVAAPRSDKFGDVKKCPACGAIVTSFSAKCGDCGHEFSNIEANASIQKLFSLLTELENKYSNPNEKVSLTSLFSSALSKASNSDELINKKCELIKNFPIPNTKDDILEFLSSAVPYARKVKSGIGSMFASKSWGGSDSNAYKEQEIGKAWKYKCEQIVMKARFSLKEDKKGLEEINMYANELGIK
jgi:hypothetical protein